MKIENLRVGQVLKNYKELCKILDIKVSTGTSKMAQFKELDRFINYHKEGNKIIIDQIYSRELKKVDNRKLGNNNEQAKCIRYLLLNFLSGYKIKDDEVVGFSKSLLLKKLFMTNDNYVNAKQSRDSYARALNVDTIAVNECLDYVENNSISAIRRAITTLKSQSVLGYKYSYSWVDNNGICHHCDTLEENAIHMAEQEVMEQMNIRNKHKIWQFGRWNEFKHKVKVMLLNEHPSIFHKLDFYYYSFHFNYSIEGIQKHMRYMEQKQGMNFEVAKAGVQELWRESLNKTIENRQTKAYNQVPFGICPDEKINYRKSKDYKPEQTKVKESITNQEYPKIEISEQMKMNLDNIDVPF